MKTLRLIFPILFLFVVTGCQKNDTESIAPAAVNTKGYIVVKCDNCKVEYGMPDQYKSFNVSGVSPQASYTYSTNYILQANINALDHEQKITLEVYNTLGKMIYNSTVTQPTTGYWGTATLLPAE